MRVLELFAGTASFSKVARGYGFKCYTIDNDPQFNCDLTTDILALDLADLWLVAKWGNPDVIWASPPCTAFSVARIGVNWNHDHTPKTDGARLGLKLLERTIKIINFLRPRYFFIENPRGKMRKVIDQFPLPAGKVRHTVTYCQYGDTRMKPTDIWTSLDFPWTPKPVCKNGAGCHEAAPRGSRTGTQGMKDSRDRAVVPPALCQEIVQILEDIERRD